VRDRFSPVEGKAFSTPPLIPGPEAGCLRSLGPLRNVPRGLCYIENLPGPTFTIVSRQGLKWLESPGLAKLPWLIHAFSTRAGGVSAAPVAGLNLGVIDADRRANVEENRKRFFTGLGAERFSLATLRQVHSAQIYQLTSGSSGGLEYIPSGAPAGATMQNRPQSGLAEDDVQAGDALVTARAGVLVSVRSADCMPILVVDTRQRAIAAIHAGWRGALERIVEKTIGEMRRVFGSHPGDLVAAIGPSIRTCCYEVGADVTDAFCGGFANGEEFFGKESGDKLRGPNAGRDQRDFFSAARPGESHPAGQRAHLDLTAVARHQLLNAGLPAANIDVADYCTACRTDLFFSHRKEGSHTGRMMAVAGIRPG
jgi:YfiH family protein